MQKFRNFLGVFKAVFVKLFHKRSLIILSEHKVRHIHISGGVQFVLVAALVVGVCWSSYSTGSFMAARDVIREQDATIRSVASTRVETNFNAMLSSAVQPASKKSAGYRNMLSDSTLSLTMGNHDKLFERISVLEKRVTELKNANDSIIETVRNKTGGQIDNLEQIIRNTGLSPEKLKRQVGGKGLRASAPKRPTLTSDSSPDIDAAEYREEDSSAAVSEHAEDADNHQGGPFISADTVEYYEAQEREIARQLEELMVLGKVVEALPLARPMNGGSLQSNFGKRRDPFTGRLAFHAGLDISGPTGTKVLSTGEGVVTFAGRSGAYGQVVDIDHGLGISTRYGHLSRLMVKEGQRIGAGDVIGIQGSTGRSTGEHVHYEVRFNDKPFNPKNFLDATHAVLQN